MRKHLFVLFSCLFVVNIGFGMTLPVLTFYTERLALAEGVSRDGISLHVGLLTSVYAVMQLLFAPLWGRFSDRLGRRPMLLLGIGGYAVSLLTFGLASNLALLYLARVIGGIFSAATYPAAAAYVSDRTNGEERNRGMAWLGTAASMGVVVGPALGGVLANRNWHFRAEFGHFVADSFSIPFFAAAALAIATLVVAVRWLPESDSNDYVAKPTKSVGVGWLELVRTLRPLLVLAFIGQFGLALFEAIFVLYANARFDFGPFEVGAIFVICGLVMALFQGILVGYLAGRVRESNQIVAGFTLMGLSLGLLATTRIAGSVYFLVAFLALGMALIAPNLSALVSKQTDQSNTGAALGIQGMANNLGQSGGPVIGGALFVLSVGTPFLVTGGLLLATGLIVGLRTLSSSRAETRFG
ncbi:MAG: MFS transporter [Acidobacteria bacterium]|nr:MAG: MFS transporter [Acidobacteriota bacterium]REJ98266.1 MAG: MFS transporter [Acidobacteriota bacterium]REK17010.1 MAG: MFS transporter [Acidobacteriota bacterium]REK42920.1 MAG: MFS transporter [Acidobacteriota bacterium]